MAAGTIYGALVGATVRIIKKFVGVSINMFARSILGRGKKKSYGPISGVSKKLKGSDIMNDEIYKYANEVKTSGKKIAIYSDSVALYGKGTSEDIDLSYSAGKVDYSLVFTEELRIKKIDGIYVSQSRYRVDVTVSDVYNFDEYREGFSMGNILNNFGYDLQKIGIIKPYKWEASYSVYGEWA